MPFLNGGLFECLEKLVTPEDIQRDPALAGPVITDGKQTVLRVDGFSERPENLMHIPNELFFGEGTDEVDLNDVLENLLTSYNPDTKTTARKKSGSFYTPREVVDYMVDEALVAYFDHNKVQKGK